MKSTKIHYQRSFPTDSPYLPEKIFHEVELEEGDDPDEAFAFAKAKVMEWAENSDKQKETKPSLSYDEEEKIIGDILSCSSIEGPDGLYTFSMIALGAGAGSAIQSAYIQQMERLNNTQQ